MAGTTQPSPDHAAGRRRLVIGSHVIVQTVIVAAIMVMVNWLVARHYLRFDWTRSSYYELSEKTKNVLKGLKSPLDVVVFIPANDERGYVQKVLEDVRNLLKEFSYYGTDKLRIEYVDPQRDLVRARQLVDQYKLETPDVVIFASGDRHKYVTLDEMVELDRGGNPYLPQPPRIRAFKGEGMFLAAIQSVTEGEPPRVYFLTGHGERDPDSTDPERGFSKIKTYLKRDNVEVEKWNLQEKMLEAKRLPDDAAALVIAGPKSRFTEKEVAELEKYWGNNGRLMIMLDPGVESGLEPLLKKWGVQVDDNMVMASMGTLLGRDLLVMEALGATYAAHPISAPLENVNTSFVHARSVRSADGGTGGSADRPHVTELVKTPDAYWGETDYRAKERAFDPKTDMAGPISLAVAMESGKPSGIDIGSARMVVIGSSSFVADGYLTEWRGNLDFVMNAMNWLLKRELNIAVGPKMPDEFSISMTRNQARTVTALVVVALPLVVAILGLVFWIQRRS